MDIDVSSKFATVTNRGGRQIYCWPPLPHTGQHATGSGCLNKLLSLKTILTSALTKFKTVLLKKEWSCQLKMTTSLENKIIKYKQYKIIKYLISCNV